jgi:putative two-component system response regulator
MLSGSSIASVRLAESIARCHHEAWDGSGYPRGLSRTQIPASARVVAIADTFDALTHDRAYGRACSFETAHGAVRAESGHRFDPQFVVAFLQLIEQLAQRFGSIDYALNSASAPSEISTARQRIENIANGLAIEHPNALQ